MQLPCQWKSIRNRSFRYLPRRQCPNAISALLKNGHIMWRGFCDREVFQNLGIGARIAELFKRADAEPSWASLLGDQAHAWRPSC